MSERCLETPVAFIVFNRPDTTQRVFAEIARARPSRLYVIADGPRMDRPGEAERCAQARSVVQQVNWPCEVLTNFSDTNLGCRNRVSSGITWLFDQVEEAIILEDDCLPDPTFFRFCADLLERYREDERVGMISGDNFQGGSRTANGSYYFSKYTHIWGWATWRRAWRQYDVDAKSWAQFYASGAFEAMTAAVERQSWRSAFDGVHEGSIDTWDFQWTLTCWSRSMLSVVPEVNLISNIGFGPDATHTTASSNLADLATSPMEWPLLEPPFLAAWKKADDRTAYQHFSRGRLAQIKSRVLGLMRSGGGR